MTDLETSKFILKTFKNFEFSNKIVNIKMTDLETSKFILKYKTFYNLETISKLDFKTFL